MPKVMDIQHRTKKPANAKGFDHWRSGDKKTTGKREVQEMTKNHGYDTDEYTQSLGQVKESIHHRPGGVDALQRLAAENKDLSYENKQLREMLSETNKEMAELGDRLHAAEAERDRYASLVDAQSEIRAQAVDDARKSVVITGENEIPKDPFEAYAQGLKRADDQWDGKLSEYAQSIRQAQEGTE